MADASKKSNGVVRFCIAGTRAGRKIALAVTSTSKLTLMLTLSRTWFNLHLRLSGTPTPELCRRSCPACRSGTSVSAPATNAGRQAGRHVCKPNQVDDGNTSRRRQDKSTTARQVNDGKTFRRRQDKETTARSVKRAGASQTGEAPPRKGDRSPVLGHIYRQPRSCQPEPQKTEPPTTRNKHLHSSAK